VSHIVGLIRAGIFPSFDDIEAERLAAYVSRNAAALDASLGDEYPALLEAIEAYRSSADAWHASEPRLVNRMLRGRLRLVDVPTWLRSFRSLLQSSERRVEALVLKGADEWVADGRLEAGAPERLIVTLRSPEVAYAVAHLGVHFALSVPLRFPFGSLARFLYTAALRLRAGVQRRTDGERSRGGRCSQTIPVALFALLPGVGRLAYLLSPALASNRLLLVSPSDYLARRLPFRLYGRLHLDALFLFWGRELSPASAPERGSSAPARPSFSPPAA